MGRRVARNTNRGDKFFFLRLGADKVEIVGVEPNILAPLHDKTSRQLSLPYGLFTTPDHAHPDQSTNTICIIIRNKRVEIYYWRT